LVKLTILELNVMFSILFKDKTIMKTKKDPEAFGQLNLTIFLCLIITQIYNSIGLEAYFFFPFSSVEACFFSTGVK